MNTETKPTTAAETKPLIKPFNGQGKNVILGITGTSGAIYGLRMMRALLSDNFNIDLILSEYAVYSIYKECGIEIKQTNAASLFPDIVHKATVNLHNNLDLKSEIFNVNYVSYGMIIAPCATNYIAGIAHGESKNLMEKAADWCLSYSKPLIVVPRETPLNRIQLGNMKRIIDAGGKIVPAMPSFEYNPQNFNDLADYIAGKVLSMFIGSRTEST
jgi:flavin prenyltransferase